MTQWFTSESKNGVGVKHTVVPPDARARRPHESDEEYANYLRVLNETQKEHQLSFNI